MCSTDMPYNIAPIVNNVLLCSENLLRVDRSLKNTLLLTPYISPWILWNWWLLFAQRKSIYLILFLPFSSTPKLSMANIFQTVLWMTPLNKTQWTQSKMVTRSLRSYISGPVISTDPKIIWSPLFIAHAKH